MDKLFFILFIIHGSAFGQDTLTKSLETLRLMKTKSLDENTYFLKNTFNMDLLKINHGNDTLAVALFSSNTKVENWGLSYDSRGYSSFKGLVIMETNIHETYDSLMGLCKSSGMLLESNVGDTVYIDLDCAVIFRIKKFGEDVTLYVTIFK